MKSLPLQEKGGPGHGPRADRQKQHRGAGNGGIKRLLQVLLLSVVCLAEPASALEQALSVGYGIAALNPELHLGRIEGGRAYDFFQVTYLLERPCRDYLALAVFLEPFASFVNRPDQGVDAGLYTGLKYRLSGAEKRGFFFTAGTGMVYTTVGFKEQGTHLNFTLEAGAGYRFGRFFIEDRLRHYSNGSTASPNRSINANVLTIGFYF